MRCPRRPSWSKRARAPSHVRTSTKRTNSRWSLPVAACLTTMNSATARCITLTPTRPMDRLSPGNRASGGSPCATAGTPARYMPAEREVLNAARQHHQHSELTTEAMPAALLGELREATASSCLPVLEAEDGLAGWRYRIPPCTAIMGSTPSTGGGQFWLVLAGEAAVNGGDPLPANSCIFVGPD